MPAPRRPRGWAVKTPAEALALPAVTWPGVDERLDAYYRARDRAGAPPAKQGPPAKDLAEALRLVELGQAVTFPPESVARRYPRAAIAYHRVEGLSDARLQVAWPETSRSPRVAEFVRAALGQ
ncbi:hypothetical protein [Amycolatopsis sp. cg9]|uniref:hypothetical protein n=1 Tax=Amycolatopsis sp. cg9 TaxID=3238801 RepID=UPI003524EEA9